MVRHLLRLNMHVDLRDREGVTPLHCACKLSGLPVVELLRENGADLMVRCPSPREGDAVGETVRERQ
jgi:ankyrin repeat protein